MAGVHFLHNVPLFANFASSDLEPLAQRLLMRKYKSGDNILYQGSPSDSLYIVKSGKVAVVVRDAEDHTQMVAELGPGQAFGEFGLLDGLPRSAGVVAREKSELLILSRPEFFMYLEQHPAVAVNLLVLLSRRLRFALQRTEDDSGPAGTPRRLARLLTDLADRYGKPEAGTIRLSIRLTLGELAGLIGRPRDDTEAAFETLRQQGLVELRGLQMTISNLEALRTVAADRST